MPSHGLVPSRADRAQPPVAPVAAGGGGHADPPAAPPPARAGRRAVVPVIVAALLLGLAADLRPAGAASDAELRARLEQLQRERRALTEELERAEAERARLTTELDAAAERVADAQAELARAEDAAAALAAEVEALEQKAAAVGHTLEQRLRAVYAGAGSDELLGLLGGASVTDLGSRSHYLSALSRRDRAELEQATAVSRQLERRRADLEQARARLEGLRADAEAAHAELDARLSGSHASVERARSGVAARDQAARQVSAELEERRRAAEQAAREAERREAARREAERQEAARREAARREAERQEAARREAAASRAQPEPAPAPPPPPEPPPPSGGKVCPQDHPRSFTDTWGAPRGGGRSHRGTDIFGNRGGRVFAITDGVVQFTRMGARSGLFLSLLGDDGHVYWYMHLQDFVASGGQRVSAGELIAHNGDTGNARGTSPHIHFEYHPGGGSAVNPYPLLRRVCG